MRQVTIPAFTKGTHNKLEGELIPQDAATDSVNWLTRDGKIMLTYGRTTQGGDGAAGKNYGEHTGYRVDGTAVRFRKVDTKVQYLNGTTWTDVITGLTASDVTFSNYQSLAGAFVFVFSPDDGIYKIPTANPASHIILYDAARNFKGYGLIQEGRTYLWGRKDDPTGLYGSWIDNQKGVVGSSPASGVYTTVAAENIGSGDGVETAFSDTLDFKGAGATRSCFGVTITVTGGEVLTDNYNGVLTGNDGATGTINYATGAWAITFTTPPANGTDNIKAAYQWENPNLRGVTDFQKSATRLAGEGFIVRQDEGGDAIRTIVVYEGSFISIKARTAYSFTPDSTDTAPRNEIIRTDIGAEGLRCAVSTSVGVVFMNTSNPTEPRLMLLERNPFGDNFQTKVLFDHYDFSKFDFDDVLVGSWDRYIIVGCKERSDENNVLILCDVQKGTTDKVDYGIRNYTKDDGKLYGGDPVSQTTYELFTEFDDLGLRIENEWISAPSLLETSRLKKVKRMRFKGEITPDQSIEIYLSRDNGDWLRLGTVVGSGDYIDYSSSFSVGTTLIGTGPIGGNDEVPVYTFFMQLKLQGEKFRQRRVKLVAGGIGYVAIQQITDYDVLHYEDKMPKTYRLKQNVSIDGTETDKDYATFV